VVGVILNLAVWFALHTVFGQVQPVTIGPLRLEVPVLASVNVPALLLALAAIVAVFRFKVGMIVTLAACSAVGVALQLAGLV
jgi:chromate transporter